MVKKLFIKCVSGAPLTSVEAVSVGPERGIAGNIPCLPLRQVLIVSSAVLRRLSLAEGDLRENIVLDMDNLQSLPSGTVLQVGDACIRLTMHCEPCRKIADKVSLRLALHNRGVLGEFLNSASIRLNDSVSNLGILCEPVPYEIADRLEWRLAKCDQTITAAQLLRDCGLSSTYARALPAILRKLPDALAKKVSFGSSRNKAIKTKVG
jgi:hypothetical protein